MQNLIASMLLEIESDAKRLAPVDTGFLRSTIHANLGGNFSGRVSADSAYAIHVEFGTSRMRAQPFLRPAYQLHKQAFLANLKQALRFRL
ncbi:HK97 gp10 family phage protein [Hymenobacter canadensis]|uniref:HK97 gp10 family phage protein n=1 Tax=Hymenobacter canadensis TaxID=2999067 RepID=A0ABY7LRW6_9BACT|nr:HK97-gp10 family putative phage morphogenesis protein [Hymenobacter canadensis]WBA43168.1 HK97 gp10 family phage protein [Hymenobacter canadensis]